MRKIIALPLAIAVLSTAFAAENKSPKPENALSANAKQVRVEIIRGVRLFPNIAYAEPPIGNLRWRRTQIKKGFKQRDTAVSCPQTLIDTLPNNKNPMPMDEDCLYLNVWAPTGNGKFPVILFIHGGALITGSGLKDFYDGSVFARQGIVFVSINYRLGELGYGPKLEKSPGSLGLMDQATALKWVIENIENFGGNAEEIFLMGQSKGAEATAAIIESGIADANVKGAIAMSGPRHFIAENNLHLPKEQLALYPGQPGLPWEKLLSERGFRLYVPEIPSIRLDGERKHRFKILVTSLFEENFSDMRCYNAKFVRDAYDYIDSFFYVLHPGTHDHGSELISLFSEDAYGVRLRDLLVRFVKQEAFTEKPFRESNLVHHLYPKFSIAEKIESLDLEIKSCEKKERPITPLKWRLLEKLMSVLGGTATTPDFQPPAVLPKGIPLTPKH